MDGYVFEIDIDEDMKRRVVASFFAPGEAMRLREGGIDGKTPQALIDIAQKGGDLIVDTVYVTKDSRIEYSIRDHEGRYNGGYFIDARNCPHVYGALVRHAGHTFVVEFSATFEDPVAENVFEIRGDPERYVTWNQGFSSESDLADYLIKEGAMIGEFQMAERSDGSWSLVAIPWSSTTSDNELEIALSAVEAEQNAKATMS